MQKTLTVPRSDFGTHLPSRRRKGKGPGSEGNQGPNAHEALALTPKPDSKHSQSPQNPLRRPGPLELRGTRRHRRAGRAGLAPGWDGEGVDVPYVRDKDWLFKGFHSMSEGLSSDVTRDLK